MTKYNISLSCWQKQMAAGFLKTSDRKSSQNVCLINSDQNKQLDIQLKKCKTDHYFLQNFQYTTMFISAFCKICEQNTECEIVFVFCNVYLLALDNTKQ